MPSYRFTVDDAAGPHESTGMVFADEEAAYTEVVRLAATLLEDNTSRLWGSAAWSLTVDREDGSRLACISINVAGASPIVLSA